MITKFFEKHLIKAFNGFVIELGEIFKTNTEILKQHTDELKIIKKALERPDGLLTYDGSNMIMSSYNTQEETNKLLDDTLIKDYFTQEFLNKSATNTIQLLVIDHDIVTIKYYKEGNGSKDIKEFNGKNYLFI